MPTRMAKYGIVFLRLRQKIKHKIVQQISNTAYANFNNSSVRKRTHLLARKAAQINIS